MLTNTCVMMYYIQLTFWFRYIFCNLLHAAHCSSRFSDWRHLA